MKYYIIILTVGVLLLSCKKEKKIILEEKKVETYLGKIENIRCNNKSYIFYLNKNDNIDTTLYVEYEGGNSEFYDSITFNSINVFGLKAKIERGKLNYKGGLIPVKITGKVQEFGKAIFPIKFCGKSCDFQIIIKSLEGVFNQYKITYFNKILLGEKVSNSYVELEYFDGNGGKFNSIFVKSSENRGWKGSTVTWKPAGVNGLNISIDSNYLNYGYGKLRFNISGEPSVAGTAFFYINICGKEIEIPLDVYIKDVEKNYYRTVTFGSQQWMYEDLQSTKFNDGTDLNLISDQIVWDNQYFNTNYPMYCKYNNDSVVLYSNNVVLNEKNICPLNWHIPSDLELKTFNNNIKYLGSFNFSYSGVKENGKFYGVNDLHVLYSKSSVLKVSRPMNYKVVMGVGANAAYSIRCIKD
jgi:hypothetical protein